MPNFQRLFSAAFCSAACFLIVGCSTMTTLRLSGTPGASFTGHYRTQTSSFDLSGALPLVVEVPSSSLQEWEFRKSDPRSTLWLEMLHGSTRILEGTAGPGTLGLKAQKEGGWHLQIIQ